MNSHFGYCERCYKKIIHMEKSILDKQMTEIHFIVLNVQEKYFIQKQNFKD